MVNQRVGVRQASVICQGPLKQVVGVERHSVDAKRARAAKMKVAEGEVLVPATAEALPRKGA